VQISPKALMSMVPLVLMMLALAGSWYVQKDRQQRIEKEVETLNETVARLERESAFAAGNGLIIEKIREDVSSIKEDLARVRAKLE